MYFVALYYIPQVQHHLSTGIMIFLWAILDCIRYPFYAFNTFKMCPQWLVWLRYSLFTAIYPLMFVAELHVWWLMLPFIQEQQLHYIQLPLSIGNQRVNIFNYSYFVVGYVLYRICTFPVNYSRMLKDREAKLKKFFSPTPHLFLKPHCTL